MLTKIGLDNPIQNLKLDASVPVDLSNFRKPLGGKAKGIKDGNLAH